MVGFVNVLVQDGMVEKTVDPVDAVVGEQQEPARRGS